MDVKVDDVVAGEGGKPDRKIRPFMYDHSSLAYYGIGMMIGKAFKIGNELQ